RGTSDGDRLAPRRRRAPLPPRASGGGAGGRLPSAVGAASGRARVSRRVRDVRRRPRVRRFLRRDGGPRVLLRRERRSARPHLSRARPISCLGERRSRHREPEPADRVPRAHVGAAHAMTVAAPPYELVIGIETHVELKTESKMFCGCKARWFGAAPNTVVCPVCLGLPGALPVPNRRAIELAITAGLALNCDVPTHTKFDRKNYMYPDLPKGYQISQYDLPFNVNGWVEIAVGENVKRVRINRAHLEEDTANTKHGEGYALIDFNRSGVPLLEIVSEPDMRSVE